MAERNAAIHDTVRHCEMCRSLLKFRISRDIVRKRFCSAACKHRAGGRDMRAAIAALPLRSCLVCAINFKPANNAQKYCARACSNIANPARNTEQQYAHYSGNWRSYFTRLVQHNRKKEHGLTVADLLELLNKQAGKCALTGRELTCQLVRGTICPTNASVDRIEHGGSYSKNNIRLVCRQANIMRWRLSDKELLSWCSDIVTWGILK